MNSQPFLSSYYIPCPVQSPLHLLPELILTAAPWRRCYFSLSFVPCDGLNGDSPRRSVHDLMLGTCERYLIWIKGLCRYIVIKDLEMKSSWIIRVVPKSCDQCSSKRMAERRRPCEDTGRDWNDAAVSPETPGDTKTGRSKPRSSPADCEGNALLLTPWVWISGLQNCEKRSLLCEATSLRWFVTTALGNYESILLLPQLNSGLFSPHNT